MNIKIAIIGLGYVGLPLLIEFSKKFKNIIGHDIDSKRIQSLKNGIDSNFQVSKKDLKKKSIYYSNDFTDIRESNVYIITLPTPIFKNNTPNLNPLKNISKKIAKIIKNKDIIIFESTVYPGVTRQVLNPIIEKYSKKKLNQNYYLGYSPERINPGDKYSDIKKIKKITSGSNKYALNKIDKLYKSIITAGTFKAKSIEIAEAAKVIENCQRDINIAFVNELYLIFNKLHLNTYDILKAASTKWNFLNFIPGLVGGHCIGVDPYYLTHISKKNNYDPKVILSGRKINDNMHKSIGDIIKKKLSKKFKLKNLNLLILGATFKENCPDIRNSKVFNLHKYLSSYVDNIDIYDPIADHKLINKEYKIKIITSLQQKKYHCILLMVGHNYFVKMGIKKLKINLFKGGIIYDFKNTFKTNENFIEIK